MAVDGAVERGEGVHKEPLAALCEGVVARVAGVAELKLFPTNDQPGEYHAVARLRPGLKLRDRFEPVRQLVTAFWSEGISVYPVLFDTKQWRRMERALAGRGLDTLAPLRGKIRHVETARGLDESLRSARTWPRNLVRRYRRVLRLLEGSTLPAHLWLALCETMVRDCLDLLFAMAGERFIPDENGIARFTSLLCGEGQFDSSQAFLWHELAGLRIAAEHGERLGQPIDGDTNLWKTFHRVVRFVRGVDRHLGRIRPTEKERRRTLKRWALAISVGLLAVGAGYLAYDRLTQPVPALADETPITHPGGITGAYFAGMNHDRAVLTRADNDIDLRSSGAVHSDLPEDRFSVRWTGYLHFAESGRYAVCGESDDGNRVRVDDRTVVEDWRTHGRRRTCGHVRVLEGWHPLEVEYFDNEADAVMRLLVGRPGEEPILVRPDALCCRDSGAE